MFNLRSIRKQKGMTIKKLAALTDLSESYISLIENMERRPSVDAAKRNANVLEFHWIKFFEQ